MDQQYEAAKQRLSSIRNIQYEIDAINDEIKQLSTVAFGCQSNISGMPRSGNTTDKVGDIATKIVDLQREILEIRERQIDQKQKCIQIINTLDGTYERAILLKYYVSGLTWPEVAEDLCMSERWAKIIRNRAIDKIKHLFSPEEKKCIKNGK